MTISIKSEDELKIMRAAGKKLAFVMQELEKNIKIGVSTLFLDELAERLILESGAKPAFKGYGDEDNPFPATICASLNAEVVHGIPSKSVVLEEGDILKIDLGLEYEGYFADMARTFPVGKVDDESVHLIETAKQAFWQGIKNLRSGAKLSEYSKVAQQVVEKAGFSVVRNLVGHGIGENLHEDPQVANYFAKGYRDLRLEVGMTLAIEPMINAGIHETVLGSDGWVFLTADGRRSAHYENTIAITKNGVEVLTQ